MQLSLETGPLAQAVGWALFHSAWQLLVIAALLWGSLALLRSASSITRYWVSVAGLLCGAILPVLTAVGVLTRLDESGGAGNGLAAALPWVGWLPDAGTGGATAGGLAGGAAWTERIAAIMPTLTILWLVAVTLLSTRLVLGWNSVQRLRTRRTRRLPAQLTRRFYRVARGLGVRVVRFLESRAVEVPMVVGWLSPVVLIPAAALLRLAPHELEAVVAHELAHIRRRDYLVNLIQTVVETAFFFHPAVWWISNRIREERECCCDDTAVSTCGDAFVYARALTELESLRAGLPRLALGATGGDLLERVRRLVRPEHRRAASTRRDLGGLVVLLSTTALLLGTGLSVGAPNEVPAEAPTPVPRKATFVVLATDSDELEGGARAGVQTRFRFRIEAGELQLGDALLGSGAGDALIEFEEEFILDVNGRNLVHGKFDGDITGKMPLLLGSLDGFTGEHFEAGQHYKTIVMMHAGDELPEHGSHTGMWTADLSVGGSPQEVAELLAEVECLIDQERPPGAAVQYREIFVFQTEQQSGAGAPPPSATQGPDSQ